MNKEQNKDYQMLEFKEVTKAEREVEIDLKPRLNEKE